MHYGVLFGEYSPFVNLAFGGLVLPPKPYLSEI
jgi:hypothetical protein